MSEFERLLAAIQAEAAEQETLAKSLPAEDGEDDKAIQAAAEDEDGAENPEDDADDADGDEAGDEMTKSITVGDQEYQVVDADELIKSLHALSERVESAEGQLVKALDSTLGLVKQQGEMIKSLSARIETMAGQGRGRKSVLAVAELPRQAALTKSLSSADAQPTPTEILAKAMTAQAAGKITALDVSRCEIALQSGQQAPADVLAKL